MTLIHGQALYDAVRHLAPLVKKSLQLQNRRLRIRSAAGRLVILGCGPLETVQVFVPFDGEPLDDEVVVEADVLKQLLMRWKKAEIAIECKVGGEVEFVSGSAAVTVSPGEGPTSKDHKISDPQSTISMVPKFYRNAMKAAFPYVSSDTHRPALCGIHVEHLADTTHVTATDGATLYTRAIPLSGAGEPIVIPGHVVKLTLRLVDVTAASEVQVAVDQERILVAQDGVFSVLADREKAMFPDFRQCLPNRGAMPTALFDLKQAHEALDAAGPFLAKSNAVRVTYNGSVQIVADGDVGGFDATVGESFDGPNPLTLTFNRDYLKRACATFGRAGELRQFVGDKLSPQIFTTAEAEDELVVVMPMRL